MAGDWIKMRAALCTHPKVIRIAEIISESTDIGRRLSTGFNGPLCEVVTSDVTRDVTLASLLRVWCATNEHTDDGVWRNSTLRTIDAAAGIPGFGAAMEAVGWALHDPESHTVTLPDFLENNAPAKRGTRSSGAERQARYRSKKATSSDAPRYVTSDVTSDARERDREEINTSTPNGVDSGSAQRSEPPAPPPPFDGHNAKALNGKSVVPLASAWDLPQEWGEDAERLGWKPAEILLQAEKFRQYWVVGKGKGTRRAVKGWRQTWSNWLAKAAENRR